MGTELDGYRQYRKSTATTITLTYSFDAIGDEHKVYVETVGLKSSKAGANCKVCLVSGGQEFLLHPAMGVAADVEYTKRVGTWVYTSELIRFKWTGIASADVLEMWLVGTDKWPVAGGG